ERRQAQQRARVGGVKPGPASELLGGNVKVALAVMKLREPVAAGNGTRQQAGKNRRASQSSVELPGLFHRIGTLQEHLFGTSRVIRREARRKTARMLLGPAFEVGMLNILELPGPLGVKRLGIRGIRKRAGKQVEVALPPVAVLLGGAAV